MPGLSDEELLRLLADRIDEKNRALFDLRMTTKRLEEVNRRLLEAEGLKGHFLSNIRNEINNPLAAILAMAGEIASGISRDPTECCALAASIQGEAFALDFQMRNIFAAADLEAGEALPLPARVDLHALVEASLATFRPLAAEKGLQLRTVWDGVPEPDVLFATDPAMLQLILANLISNALKFGGSGGTVTVAVGREDGTLRLSVADQGIGIDPAHHTAIFERFHQLDSGKIKGYAGQGLGLSVVRALLEVLGGSVTVESAPGRGSQFTVRLPEAGGGAGADVVADAGNEFFFDG